MKEYVTLETHWKDLKVTKQKVNQTTMGLMTDTYDPTIDDIHKVMKYFLYEKIVFQFKCFILNRK